MESSLRTASAAMLDQGRVSYTLVQMDDSRRRSRWIMRILEWDDPRARYPNLWHEGMPRLILAFDTVASRLRLGDLIAVYSPASQKHPERSGRFVGLARVSGLRL